MLLLQLQQLLLLLLLQVSECMAMLPLHAGYTGSMLLLCSSQLSLQALSLGLAVTDLMPVNVRACQCYVEHLLIYFEC